MQEIRSSNPPVVTGICDPSKSRARHHRSQSAKQELNDRNIVKDSQNAKNKETSKQNLNNITKNMEKIRDEEKSCKRT